ncbi:N-acetylmuramoyl-L-alanine amidase [Cypionkella aquatica]|uniref:N-acetylmuramoyl-L-alanine amidase n=1 Tax=Cypionkella aquatica TaxID=1756042 RepID=A0AA37U3D1_9RHOB|nr:N-acetylmuramoyl-L-alanine amidase [Cypionkella aquatica]GLS87661.1 N-acetylmuramoyl-L-alanine amidase [Cypionkella aquatica]
MKALFNLVLAICLLVAVPLRAQELSGLARLDAGASSITDAGADLQIDLGLSQAVPWRVRVLDDPARLLVDFREVDWTGLSDVAVASDKLVAMRAGVFRPGWSRLVLELAEPMAVASAEMRTEAGVGVHLRLQPVEPQQFAALAALPEPADWTSPQAVQLPAMPKKSGKLVVVLDPGHGGIDPGAESDGQNEKSLVLKFARELKEVLLRDGGFAVVMTREEDVFVPLETRISIAHQAGADVFISLHADAIAEGDAVGATVYTLAADASDAASAALAERHDRDDLLAGVDLAQADDLVAEVLLDMARTDTSPRTERLAMALETSIKAQGLKMHRHPRQQASFSVLKSADIPSILLELGFLSSERDLKRLNDAGWRAKMAEAITGALKAWAKQDAGLQALPLK